MFRSCGISKGTQASTECDRRVKPSSARSPSKGQRLVPEIKGKAESHEIGAHAEMERTFLDVSMCTARVQEKITGNKVTQAFKRRSELTSAKL